MVTAVTSFGRSGVSDWLVQRVTAVVLAAYIVFIMGFIVSTPDLQYAQWDALFDSFWVRVFSVVALLSVSAHAWIGCWAVLTDYITVRLMGSKATVWRIAMQLILATINVFYVVWGFETIWGL